MQYTWELWTFLVATTVQGFRKCWKVKWKNIRNKYGLYKQELVRWQLGEEVGPGDIYAFWRSRTGIITNGLKLLISAIILHYLQDFCNTQMLSLRYRYLIGVKKFRTFYLWNIMEQYMSLHLNVISAQGEMCYDNKKWL